MRQYPDRPIVGVGAIIIHENRVLLVRRANAPLKGQWSLPGGGVEVGETLVAAVTREVLEETGLEVRVGPVLEVLDRIHPDDDGRVEYHFVLIDYLCHVVGGSAAARTDASEIRWVSAGELRDFGLQPEAMAVVAKGFEWAASAAPSLPH